MMDFSVSQAHGLRFMYVLPFSPTRALVETTYISAAPREAGDYERDLRAELERRGVHEYAIGFREAGRIAMSTRPVRSRVSPRVLNLGLRGGLAKPSTGYAFAAIQEFSAELAARVVARPGLEIDPPAPRSVAAVAMDRVFLSYLERHPERGPALFVDLFERLPADLLCRFLTDHGSPLDGLRVMASTPLARMTAEVLRSRARWLRSA
jgi:lycopene beta-cyclase